MFTLNTDVVLNGTRMNGETAGKIMFVECTLLKKKYTINTTCVPIEVSIYDYSVTETDIKSYADKPVEESEHYEREVIRKAGCGSCGKKK